MTSKKKAHAAYLWALLMWFLVGVLGTAGVATKNGIGDALIYVAFWCAVSIAYFMTEWERHDRAAKREEEEHTHYD